MAVKEIRPQPGPQMKFLTSPADIVFYGGSAGGGKSWSLLLEVLRGIHNPAFNTVLFRRTFPMIRNPGGLWDASSEIFPLVGARPRESSLTWQFPSGASCVFRHLKLDSNVYDWQGSEIVYIGFDELTHFLESQFWYMLSRNRSTCSIKPFIRATCNPDADSWVRALIDWWIGDDGLAIPDRSGITRHFIRRDGEIIWLDEPDSESKSLCFISASIYDNKALLEKDPGYLNNLKSLPLVERERLLGGNWNVKAVAGKLYQPHWVELVDSLPPLVPGRDAEVRFWDLAGTAKKVSGNDPDYTAGAKMARIDGVYYITDYREDQVSPAGCDRMMLNTAQQDGPRCLQRWEQEHGGSSGIRDSAHRRQVLAGYDAMGILPYGDKVTRFKPFSSACEFGKVKMLRAPWNQRVNNGLQQFPDAKHDEDADTMSGAYNCLVGAVGRSSGTSSYQQ